MSTLLDSDSTSEGLLKNSEMTLVEAACEKLLSTPHRKRTFPSKWFPLIITQVGLVKVNLKTSADAA